MSVKILDENPKPGGRIYSQLNDGFKLVDPVYLGPDYQKGQTLLAEFDAVRRKIDYLHDAMVFGTFENRIMAFHRAGRGERLAFNNLVVATGAYDRPVPFPGWTLPGVMTAGGAQTLSTFPFEDMLLE